MYTHTYIHTYIDVYTCISMALQCPSKISAKQSSPANLTLRVNFNRPGHIQTQPLCSLEFVHSTLCDAIPVIISIKRTMPF